MLRRLILTLALMATPSFAFANCYNAQQLEAEQGLRIHSELMVIALNCQHLNVGTPLNQQYEAFTRRHSNLIRGYEETIRAYFAAKGVAKPEAELHEFRTILANRIANEAVRLQSVAFCNAYADRIVQANAMDEGKFRKWAQTVFPSYPLTQPICPGVQVATQSK